MKNNVLPPHYFALRRLHRETARWASSLRGFSQRIHQAATQIQETCNTALVEIDKAIVETQDHRGIERQRDHQRVMEVLDRQDLDEMIAERDRLLEKMKKR